MSYTQVWEPSSGCLVPACAQCDTDDCSTGRVGTKQFADVDAGIFGIHSLVSCSGFTCDNPVVQEEHFVTSIEDDDIPF